MDVKEEDIAPADLLRDKVTLWEGRWAERIQ